MNHHVRRRRLGMDRVIILGLSMAIAACNSNPPSPAAPSNPVAYNLSPVIEQIQQWVDRGYYPGASLIVVKDGNVICERYFGDYRPETVVYIASAGKWLAAAAIAAVVDEGKLSWDDPVRKWLPEFKDAKGRATLRQLLSHTSGYPDYQPKDRHPDNYQTLAEAVEHIAPLPAVAEPGTRFQYGGLAMQVAGRMAELASQLDWETLFQQKIARPLRMSDTHFTPVDPTPGHNPMLGGGARSTLRDYANFLEMISQDGMFEGRRILSAKSILEMRSDQVRAAAVSPGEFVQRTRGLTHRGIYGLGEWREMLDSHGHAILISSPSWAGTYPWIDKTHNIYGVFLTHVDVTAAHRDHFEAFYSSAILPILIGHAID
jgi:serine-type D-Ala-D-Ala carboxypeptidase